MSKFIVTITAEDSFSQIKIVCIVIGLLYLINFLNLFSISLWPRPYSKLKFGEITFTFTVSLSF